MNGTLASLLNARADSRPGGVPLIVTSLDDVPARHVTYAMIRRRAVTIASWLSAAVNTGDRVLLAYPPGAEFLGALFGAAAAGVIPVPVPPPLPGPLAERYEAISRDCCPAATLTCAEWHNNRHFERYPFPPVTVTDTMPGRAGGRLPASTPPSGIAYLQYTSGTTGTPKGVRISHENVTAGGRITARHLGLGPGVLAASWLPHWHDMGLAEFLLAVHSGFTLVATGPEQFIRNPAGWLHDIAARKVSAVAMPQFAYDILTAKVPPGALDGLDLTHLTSAGYGADVANPDALDRFAAAFAGSGLPAGALSPVYGLSEIFPMAAAGRPGHGPAVVTADPDALRKGRITEAPEGVRLATCGMPLPGVTIGIWRNGSPQLCGPGEIGEILLRGSSVASGYWMRPDPRVTVAGRRWMPAGDLGALLPSGDLLVLGRAADLITAADGSWHYPALIERTAAAAGAPHGVRSHTVAAFQHGDAIVLAANASDTASDTASAAIAGAIGRDHGITARVILASGRIPATTSGKVRRRECSRKLRLGDLQPRRPGSPRPWHPGDLHPADGT